jgi:flap endonuclease-1
LGVALRELIVPYKEPVGWDTIPGIAVIDAHNALYQFLSIIRQPDGTPLMDSRGRVTSHLSGLLFRTTNMTVRGIRPVYVFDGTPPACKDGTIADRRAVRDAAYERWTEARAEGDIGEAFRQARSSSRVDAEVVATSKRLLHLLGIPGVQAPSEGEAQAVHIVREGKGKYVVSQDYDTLLFGAPLLVRNLTLSGKRRMQGRQVAITPERIALDAVLKGIGITRDDLIKVGVLMGTDFNQGITGIGPKKALKLVKNAQFEETVKKSGFDPGEVLEFFRNPPVTDNYSLEWRTPDLDGVVRFLCDEYEFAEERVRKAFGGGSVTPAQKTLGSWF